MERAAMAVPLGFELEGAWRRSMQVSTLSTGVWDTGGQSRHSGRVLATRTGSRDGRLRASRARGGLAQQLPITGGDDESTPRTCVRLRLQLPRLLGAEAGR